MEAALAADPSPAGAPTEANTDNSRRAPGCPSGHDAGAEDSAMGRRSEKVTSQMGQRYS